MKQLERTFVVTLSVTLAAVPFTQKPSALSPRFKDATVQSGADAQSVLLLKFW